MTAPKRSRTKPARADGVPVGVFEHRRTTEQRDQRRAHPDGGMVQVQTYRVVCTCGWSSSWNDQRSQSIRLGLQHGSNGQLAMVLPGTRAGT